MSIKVYFFKMVLRSVIL
uniref:Uncharacterized protein n=1 Tax=Arundo donax TaxID=35708 RepID=A0A0A8ZJC2_ARUDO